jgi:hypothetical protein
MEEPTPVAICVPLTLHVSGCNMLQSYSFLCELHGEFVHEQYGNIWWPSVLRDKQLHTEASLLKEETMEFRDP